jgi:plasmid segregation protein ParM
MSTEETTPSVLAIDVGYGNLKAVWGGGVDQDWREICFRSVSPAVSRDVSLAGFGSTDRILVPVNGTQYAVGPHADRMAGGQLSLNPNYIETPEYEALICGAWHYYLRDMGRLDAMVDLLVLGLPVSNFAQQRTRLLDLGGRLRQTPLPEAVMNSSLMGSRLLNVRARQVLVLPQPFGTLMLVTADPAHMSILDEGCLSLVIDPGYSTFDWLVSDGTTPRMDMSGAFAGGVSRLLRAVARKVSQDHGIDVPELPRIEQALHDGVLNTGVRKIDMHAYDAAIAQEARAVVSSFLQRFVPGELGIKHIFLTGGGARFFLDALRDRLPEYDICVLPDSLMGNARGYYVAGCDLLAVG